MSTAPLCGVDGHNNADVTMSVAWPALCCVADVFAGLTQSPEPPRRAGDQTNNYLEKLGAAKLWTGGEQYTNYTRINAAADTRYPVRQRN